MENKLEVQIGNKKIVAFINDWHDDMPKEILYRCLTTMECAFRTFVW